MELNKMNMQEIDSTNNERTPNNQEAVIMNYDGGNEDVDDDDDGTFFIEASRQAARDRQERLRLLKGITSSSSSSSTSPSPLSIPLPILPTTETATTTTTTIPGINSDVKNNVDETTTAVVDVDVINQYEGPENDACIKDDEDRQRKDHDVVVEEMKKEDNLELLDSIEDKNDDKQSLTNDLVGEISPTTTIRENENIIVDNDDDDTDVNKKIKQPQALSTSLQSMDASLKTVDERVLDYESSQTVIDNEEPFTGNKGNLYTRETPLSSMERVVSTDDERNTRLSSDGKVIFEPINDVVENVVDQDNVDMGLLVLTRALLVVKSIVERRQ